MNDNIDRFLSVAQTVVIVAVAYYAYRGLRFGSQAIDAGTSKIADLYVSATNPIVPAQIQIKSAYFEDDGKLTQAARKVFYEGFPDLYFKIFENDRLKPQYINLLDNGERYTNADFM